MSRIVSMILVLVPLAVSARAAVEASPFSDTPRVLVTVGESDTPLESALGERAAACFTEYLSTRGFNVVDEEHARRLDRRTLAALERWTQAEALADERESRMLLADVLVTLTPRDVRQKSQQGRYIVECTLDAHLVGADDARSYGRLSFNAKGRSIEGYAQAKDALVRDLCERGADENGFAPGLEKRIREVRAEEVEKGSLYTIAFYIDGESLADKVATFDARLREVDELDPASLYLINSSMSIGDDETQQSFAVYQCRYRGANWQLRSAIHKITQELRTPEDAEKGITYDPMFMTHRRRIDVVLRRRVPEKTLAQETQRLIENILTVLAERHGDYLEGKKLTVLPTALTQSEGMTNRCNAFGRSYWQELDRVKARLSEEESTSDPMQFGPVTVGGVEFENLAAARQHWVDMSLQFKDTTAGKLAHNISELVSKGLESVTGRASIVQGDRDDDAMALDVIRYETELFRDEGAVDEATIEFFQREGADAVVIPSLQEFLGDHMLRIAIMDLATGEMLREHTYYPIRFEKELTSALRP